MINVLSIYITFYYLKIFNNIIGSRLNNMPSYYPLKSVLPWSITEAGHALSEPLTSKGGG